MHFSAVNIATGFASSDSSAHQHLYQCQPLTKPTHELHPCLSLRVASPHPLHAGTNSNAFIQRNQKAADVQLRTLRPVPSSTSQPPKPNLTMQRPPTLWDRMSDETRAAIESYELTHSREFCIEFLTRERFYTQCTFGQIQTLLIVLNKERTLSNFQNLFN